MLTVEVRWKLKRDDAWHNKAMDPAEYFWRGPSRSGGAWDCRDVTKHDHVFELLDTTDMQSVEYVATLVSDSETGSSFGTVSHFWNGRDNFICMMTEVDHGKVSRELIYSGLVPRCEDGSQVVRVSLDGPTPKLTVSSFMWREDGEEFYRDMQT